VRQSKENNERIRYLSDAEEIKLRAVMQRAHADRIPEFEVAVMTGMRMSEQLTLEWNQIDLDAGTVHLDQTKNGSSRFVRLNSRALAIMHMLHASSIGSGRVFIAKRPDWFRAAVREAGLKDFTWHCLRHTFASRLVMAGVDLRTVQGIDGTQEHYPDRPLCSPEPRASRSRARKTLSAWCHQYCHRSP